uniref:Uncharacterized protein LOC111126737 n=1 Tax=Crassostrea virginica TaxID=6565 RepID=A0A8B8DJW3_CRAVI|nr:uncharacterized protein LOC111126737 [Crassostrea virginica]
MDKLPVLFLFLLGTSNGFVKGNRGGTLFAFRDVASSRGQRLWLLPSSPQSGAIVPGDVLLVPLIPIEQRDSPSSSRPRRTVGTPRFRSSLHFLREFLNSNGEQFEL